MKSEWLRTTIDQIIDDYNKYLNGDNSVAGLRFRKSAIQVIKMLKEDRKQIQLLRYLRNDYLIRYNYNFEKRKQKVLNNIPLISKETTLTRFKLSEKAKRKKTEFDLKNKDTESRNSEYKSFDLF